MPRIFPLVALALSLSPAACDTAKAPLPAPLPIAEGPVTDPPSTLELAALAKSEDAFAVDLFAQLRARTGNLAFSPMSVYTALTMTWAGARGDTASQMQKALHAEGTAAQAADVAGKLLGNYRDPAKKVTLRVANRLFGEKTYAFEQGYLDLTKAAFGAPLEPLDFKHDADGSRRLINGWVSAQTHDRIHDLIPAAGLDADTRLVLANAIYFLGDWAEPFAKNATTPGAFHATPAAEERVPTMHQTAGLRFAAADGVKILEMPYQGGELAMTVVLPDAVDGLAAVEQRLSTATLGGWLGGLRSQEVVVSLPKFEIDPADALSLGEPLQALGMSLPFDRARADLTGIANPPSPADRLFVAKVFHKAFVKVDEKGTEAAAATAVVAAVAGMAAPTSAPPEFRADHPFLFLVRELRSGTILFMGRVADPASK